MFNTFDYKYVFYLLNYYIRFLYETKEGSFNIRKSFLINIIYLVYVRYLTCTRKSIVYLFLKSLFERMWNKIKKHYNLSILADFTYALLVCKIQMKYSDNTDCSTENQCNQKYTVSKKRIHFTCDRIWEKFN